MGRVGQLGKEKNGTGSQDEERWVRLGEEESGKGGKRKRVGQVGEEKSGKGGKRKRVGQVGLV